jgi:hypothetical protein
MDLQIQGQFMETASWAGPAAGRDAALPFSGLNFADSQSWQMDR